MHCGHDLLNNYKCAEQYLNINYLLCQYVVTADDLIQNVYNNPLMKCGTSIILNAFFTYATQDFRFDELLQYLLNFGLHIWSSEG